MARQPFFRQCQFTVNEKFFQEHRLVEQSPQRCHNSHSHEAQIFQHDDDSEGSYSDLQGTARMHTAEHCKTSSSPFRGKYHASSAPNHFDRVWKAVLYLVFFFSLPICVDGKIGQSAAEDLASISDDMRVAFVDCDQEVASFPELCDITIFASQAGRAFVSLKNKFSTADKYGMDDCDEYYGMYDILKATAETCRANKVWGIKCRALETFMDELYEDELDYNNMICNVVTRGARYPIPKCGVVARVIINRYNLFDLASHIGHSLFDHQYGRINEGAMGPPHVKKLFRDTAILYDRDDGGIIKGRNLGEFHTSFCMQNVCMAMRQFYRFVRPHNVQEWPSLGGGSKNRWNETSLLMANATGELVNMFRFAPDGDVLERRWQPNEILDAGCDTLLGFNFDPEKCMHMQDVLGLCQCIIPERHAALLSVQDGGSGVRYSESCDSVYQMYTLFGRRGLYEGKLSATGHQKFAPACAQVETNICNFYADIRRLPHCRVADLPTAIECKIIDWPEEYDPSQFNLPTIPTQFDSRSYTYCPFLRPTDTPNIIECNDGFTCHIKYDGYSCCSISTINAIKQSWHTVDTGCCEFNHNYTEYGEIAFTTFSRMVPGISGKPTGRAKCPPENPVMCNDICGGFSEFCCGNSCEQRSCSPLIYPDPVYKQSSNDTRLASGLDFYGEGCCNYEDKKSKVVHPITSKNACLYLASIDDEVLAVTVNGGGKCEHHLAPDEDEQNILSDFRLGCQNMAGGPVYTDECYLKTHQVRINFFERQFSPDGASSYSSAASALFAVLGAIAGCIVVIICARFVYPRYCAKPLPDPDIANLQGIQQRWEEFEGGLKVCRIGPGEKIRNREDDYKAKVTLDPRSYRKGFGAYEPDDPPPDYLLEASQDGFGLNDSSFFNFDDTIQKSIDQHNGGVSVMSGPDSVGGGALVGGPSVMSVGAGVSVSRELPSILEGASVMQSPEDAELNNEEGLDRPKTFNPTEVFDFFEPLDQVPTAVIQVELFKKQGGSMGLVLEPPNSTIIKSFIDPVVQRWGWELGDEITAMLVPRFGGQPQWIPIVNGEMFHWACARCKEKWDEQNENRKIAIAVFRRRRNRKDGRIYPEIPKALYRITKEYMDHREEGMVDDLESVYSDDSVENKFNDVVRPPRRLPRTDWLRYEAAQIRKREQQSGVHLDEHRGLKGHAQLGRFFAQVDGIGPDGLDERYDPREQPVQVRFFKDKDGNYKSTTEKRITDADMLTEKLEGEVRVENQEEVEDDFVNQTMPRNEKIARKLRT